MALVRDTKLRAIFDRHGYDPDDPARGLDVPDKLLRALAATPFVEPGEPLHRRYLHATPPTTLELEVVELLACGHGCKEIAAIQNVSIWTVKERLKITYRKLEARNAAHAVALAIAHRLIPLDVKA